MTEPKEIMRTSDIEENDSGMFDFSTPAGTPALKRRRNYSTSETPVGFSALIRKRISQNKRMIISCILHVILVITIIVLIVKLYSENVCPICATCVSLVCPESWFIHEGKYFYASNKAANWSTSSNICSSINTSLAVISTQKELDFCADILGSDHWFGLTIKDHVWQWPNGTEFSNQFPVEGGGFCAFVNGKGAYSTMCSVEKRFLCNYPEVCHKAG